MMKRTTRRAATPATFLALLAFAACGSDDPAGPSAADLVATWSYQAQGTAPGRSCTVGNVVLNFVQSGSSLTGEATFLGGNNLACTPGGSANFTGGSDITDIVQNGANVSFAYGSTSGTTRITGTIAADGSTMSGTVTFPLTFSGSGVVEFSGTWTATRD